MQENKINLSAPINTRNIIIGMILVSIIVHLGFGATYIKHFPVFEKFTWVHHIHGALMGIWVLLLIVQPFLIHYKKIALHRLLGKLSYVLAPLMIVSMLFIAKLNYEKNILKKSAVDVMAVQSITWMQIVLFTLFYSLAIYFRRNTYFHMRFMIATAIVMLGPPLNRAIHYYFPGIPVEAVLVMVLYVKTGLALALLLSDITKNNNWKPYAIVFSAFLFSDIVFHARYTEAWQAAGKFILNTFYQ
jgi:hypothetical protein